MGTFGNEIVDVTAPGPYRLVAGLGVSDTIAAANLAALNALSALGPLPFATVFKTLYFPPGRYVIGSARDGAWARDTFFASLQIKPQIQLWFAPDAVLLPASGCILELGGPMFGPDAGRFDLSRGGRVVFGPTLPTQVVPEWWKVTGVSDRAALQAAIQAAWLDRSGNVILGALRERVDLAPLPIVLLGPYTLDDEVVAEGDQVGKSLDAYIRTVIRPNDAGLEVVSGNSMAWTLRGLGGGEPHLRWSSTHTGLSLLRVHDCEGLTVEGVRFDATDPRPTNCLTLASRVSRRRVDTRSQGIALQRCAFRGGGTLLQIGPTANIFRSSSFGLFTQEVENEGATDYAAMVVSDCTFDVNERGIAAELRAGNTVPMAFVRCDFRGIASTFFSVWAGRTLFDHCTFRNATYVTAPPPVTITNWFVTLGRELPNGADIFWRRELPSVRDGVVTLVPVGEVDPGLTLLHCRSESEQVFASVSPSPLNLQRAQQPVTMLNLIHDRSYVPALVPSIVWGGQDHVGSNALAGDNNRVVDLNRGAMLVCLGGTLSGEVSTYLGANGMVMIGCRRQTGRNALGGVRPIITEGGGMLTLLPTLVLGLPVDEGAV